MRKGYRFQPLLLATFFICLLSASHLLAQQDTWVNHFGSGLADSPEDILVDDAGNSYVSGYFRDTLWIGTTELIASGKNDVFLAKFAPDGQLAWINRYGWNSNEFAHGLAFDAMGNVIMVGEYQDSTIFEGDTLFSGDSLWYGAPAETYDVFWVRVTPSGTMDKFWGGGWFGGESFNEVQVGLDSLYYFAGLYRTFNNWTFANPDDLEGLGSGYDDAIWVRSDSSGFMDHKAIAAGRYVDRASAIALVGDSLVVMGGTFQDTCYFRHSSQYGITGFEDDVFIACYSDTGRFKWAVQGGSKAIDDLTALVTDAQGNIYFSGAYDSSFTIAGQTLVGTGHLDGVVGKLSVDGNLLWLKHFGGMGFDVARDLRITNSGDLLVTGYFQRQMDLGSGIQLEIADTFDQNAYVVKLDAAGNALWAKNLGGSGPDLGVAVDEDAAGYIYAVGTFAGTGQFGQVSATALGGEDIYVLRMNADGAVFSTEAVSPISNVNVWPNPAKSEFQVQFDLKTASELTFLLSDLNGQVVMEQSLGRKAAGMGNLSVDASRLPAGLYIYQLRSVNGAFAGKIALMR
ncbi:MAG: T9SS type A sorting domain-containing protein [Bacteroidetes bacterium]|nr:T9SS type A sorting domain-containing protein [Bacteroidota bacterium]